jgi:arylsulfatase A-like enzyme
VPLMLRIPGVNQPGQHITAPVGQIDVVPTLLDALGMPVPDHLEGASWLPHLRGEAPLTQENVFIEWNGNDGWGHAIRKGQILESQLKIASEERIRSAMRGDPARGIITPQGLKYVWWQSGHRELYDLRSDPGETTNLAECSEHQPTITALQDTIQGWQRQTSDSLHLPD